MTSGKSPMSVPGRGTKRMRTGQVWINTPLADETHCLPYPDIPFGGYKQSGVGREMGVEGYLEYTELV